ncbi:MAG: hypothetical protein OHK0029_03860 [Armatimonadaceae bacterium]
MSLDKALANAQSAVIECLAVGYVDIESGLLLGVKTVDKHPAEVLDLVAAATADIYQGPNVMAIEDIFKRRRGDRSEEHYFQDIIVMSTNLIHVFLRGKKHPNHVAVFVCKESASIGMVLSKARVSLNSIEESF